jgi:hypothetical protein
VKDHIEKEQGAPLSRAQEEAMEQAEVRGTLLEKPPKRVAASMRRAARRG